MKTKIIDFLGYPLYTGKLGDIKLDNLKVINTINPHSYYCTRTDPEFSAALKDTDLLLPDGVGIIYGANMMGIKAVERISGSDIHLFLLNNLNEQNGKVFYMGSTENTLLRISDRLSLEYPNLTVGYYPPPFKNKFSIAENSKIISVINDFAPDVLFVGMTAPKQEKWVHDHFTDITAKHIVSVGAVFDFYAGTVVRPGRIWIILGLEWFRRFIGEPNRLWKRNFISSPVFLWDVAKSSVKYWLIKWWYRIITYCRIRKNLQF